MTPSAQKAWITFYNEIGAELSLAAGPVASALSKIEGYAARLALVVQLTKWACGEASRDKVVEESMRSGIRMALWFGNEAKRIYGLLGAAGEELSGHCDLMGWVREHGGSTTVRDLVRGKWKYRGATAEAKCDLERLVNERLLERIDVPPSPNPSVD